MRFTLLLLLLLPYVADAQTVIPFNSPRWKVKGKTPYEELHLGKPALRLQEGGLLLEDANFKNGIIEFDIALAPDRYFPAIEFRMQDENNYEQYYIRPHQSGNPDAMQYTPVYNDLPSWQLYHGPGYSNAALLPVDRWMHIKLVISGSEGEVYFDQDTTPVLFIRHLKRDVASGMIKLNNVAPCLPGIAIFLISPPMLLALKARLRLRLPCRLPSLLPGKFPALLMNKC